jgi:hypothetical protein
MKTFAITLSLLLAMGSKASAELHTLTVELPPVKLDKPYPAMEGPFRNIVVPLDMTKGYFLVSTKIEVLNHGQLAPEFLCHARLGITAKGVDLEHLKQLSTALIAISQGNLTIDFPPGYGLVMRSPVNNPQLVFGAQLQNPAAAKDSEVMIRAVIQYRDADDGLKRLRPLRIGSAGDELHSMPNMLGYGMFMVKPGPYHTSGEVHFKFPRNAPQLTIHFARAHLHAFAKSLELYDETTHSTAWKGLATTNAKTLSLDHVDAYSSAKGFAIYRDHHYIWKAEYNNTSANTVDGMAFLHAFYDL